MIKENNQQVPILDSLRAVAALSVCFFHFVCGPVNFINNKLVLGVFHLGLNGVQLFFVISGFVIPLSISKYDYKIKKYFKFLLKRFLRLEPPYLFSIVLAILFFFFRKFYTDIPDVKHSGLEVNQLLLHIGYLIPFSHFSWINRVYWTLAIEFQFYLFMGLFYFVIVNKNIKIRILGYLCALSLSFIGNEKFLLFWLPVFLLGNILFLFHTRRIGKVELYIMLLIIFIKIALFIPYPAFGAALIAVLAILFFKNYSNPVLNWFGKISYSLYLIHTIIGLALINVLSSHVHSTLSKIGVLLLGFAVSVFSSYLMFLWIEKPSKKISSKVKL